MKYGFLLFIPFFLLSQDLQTRSQVLMGTFAHMTLPSNNSKQISQSFSLIRDVEHSLSSYDNEALVYGLNKHHTIEPDDYLIQAIQNSKQYYQDTQGYFDITIGSISKKLYHFGEDNTTIPSQKALQVARLNINAIEINKTQISTDENITIDLGGMGKGYAVDVVADFLEEQNISQGIVALSGDIRCIDLCTFALQSPYSEQTFARLTSKIPQLSISTSGTYRHYVDSQENHHLINPKTATQGRDFISVSLFSHNSNAKIDAYATAITVMPKEKALIFLKEHKELGFVLVTSNGEVLYGNIDALLTLKWVDYKENATIERSTKNTIKNSAIERSLIHPDTINPSNIGK